MGTAQASLLFQHLRHMVAAKSADQLDDRQLLQCFTENYQQTAFEALVRRHGPLVRALCQRILGNPHDADDAFQATFLVLARRAGSITKSEALGSWSYKVA